MAKPWYFNVRPRYTAGSPAMVDAVTAERVAGEEKRGYERAIEGIYGPEEQHRAICEGLFGIAEKTQEIRGGWKVYDLIMHEQYFRPFKSA